jgi:hypothetical protein
MKKDNTLPSGIHDLLQLGEKMGGGLALHGPWLKMTQTPEGAFRAILEGCRETERNYAEARAAQGAAGKESTAADKVLTRWLTSARAFLTIDFGTEWSAVWFQIGATQGRTAVPKRMPLRLELARGMVDYFKKNPEATYPGWGITAERGEAHRERLLQAQRELIRVSVDRATKKQARDAAERALRRKMRQVVVILGTTIRPEDRRWLEFGLRQPQRSLGETRLVLAPPAVSEFPLPLALPAPAAASASAQDAAAA